MSLSLPAAMPRATILPPSRRVTGETQMACHFRFARAAAVVVLVAMGTSPAVDAATRFTYQGTLDDGGSPANGFYDFQFRVVSSTNADVSTLRTVEDVLVTQGVFTVPLDFGALFNTNERYLRIGVRAGESTGPYTTLSPNTLIGSAPNANFSESANYASDAFSAVIADDVIDSAIDAVDIADGAVTTAKVANGGITTEKLASTSIDLSRFKGENSLYGFSISAPANDCSDYTIPFNGDVKANDIPFLSLPGNQVLPDKVMVTALRVPSDNNVVVRICNVGTASVSTGSLTWRLTTLR